jgi:hypothetical protein
VPAGEFSRRVERETGAAKPPDASRQQPVEKRILAFSGGCQLTADGSA